VYRALLVDFYGTLVAEDDALVARITERVAGASGRGASAAEVARLWNERFAELCGTAHGASFRTQRAIELESLEAAARQCDAAIDTAALAEELFAYWAAPRPLEGAARFLRGYAGPVCVVSNIDSAELDAAIRGLGWEFEHVVTSEACRAYKPRAEMFHAALGALGCDASEVLHVGDSIGSDLTGAGRLGIDVAWVNAAGRTLPDSHEHRPRHTIRSVGEVPALLSSTARNRRR
jgi:2-haloacid dehalogenase/putative hydrolase of the HAD superfamily